MLRLNHIDYVVVYIHTSVFTPNSSVDLIQIEELPELRYRVWLGAV